MQFKLKTLAAAVALAAAAGSANAAFQTSPASTVSLFFTAYDAVTGEGFVQNLAPLTSGSFIQTTGALNAARPTSASFNLNSLFATNFGDSGSNIRWSVFSYNGNAHLISTVNGTATPQVPGNITAAVTAMTGDWATNLNAAAGTNDFVYFAGTNAANPAGVGDNFFSNLTDTVTGGYGSLNFYRYSSSSGNIANIGGTWTLASNGALTYGVSAVPVPAALWLFGSGLLGLVGVARRRKS